MIPIIISLFLLLSFNSCEPSAEDPSDKWLNNIEALLEHNAEKISISQGIGGTLVFTEGNCMPGAIDTTCRRYPVQRTVHIHECTHRSQADHIQGGFHKDIETAIIASVITDREGFFEAELPPGKYSIFVEEDNLLYANLWDSVGCIQPASVNSGETTVRRINITHSAYY